MHNLSLQQLVNNLCHIVQSLTFLYTFASSDFTLRYRKKRIFFFSLSLRHKNRMKSHLLRVTSMSCRLVAFSSSMKILTLNLILTCASSHMLSLLIKINQWEIFRFNFYFCWRHIWSFFWRRRRFPMLAKTRQLTYIGKM